MKGPALFYDGEAGASFLLCEDAKPGNLYAAGESSHQNPVTLRSDLSILAFKKFGTHLLLCMSQSLYIIL